MKDFGVFSKFQIAIDCQIFSGNMRIQVSQRSRFWFGLFLLGSVYITIVIFKAENFLAGDERGYLAIAKELSRGRLSSVNWWGPGYPLLLAPFIKFEIPLIWAKLCNVAFLLCTIVYLRSSMLLYMTKRCSTRIALIMGMYLPFFFYLHMNISEKFAVFLMSAIVFHYLASQKGGKKRWKHLILSSVLLAWLALTKVFFGYVITASTCLLLIVRLVYRCKARESIFILITAFLLCVPYLWNNYNLTKKVFYWSTSGGSSLYWISTPFTGETGSWFGRKELEENVPVHKEHYLLFNSLASLTPVERDEILKHKALQNIRKKPLKFLSNVTSNILRLLFDFPYDFHRQTWKTSWVVVPNAFLLTLFFTSLYPAYVARRSIPSELFSILGFAAIAFIGSSFLSAYNRMFTILVPIICVWTAYVWTRLVRLDIVDSDRLMSNNE